MSDTKPQSFIFILLRTLPVWLALARTERAKIADAAFAECLKACPDFSFRYFDAEAFSGTCTDIMMVPVRDMTSHAFALEALRDSPLFSVPYFEIVDIIPTLEDGYRAYETSAQLL